MKGIVRGRAIRRTALVAASLAIILVALIAAAGWYYSSLVRTGALLPDYSPDDLDFRVVRVEGNQITLAPDGGDQDNLKAATSGGSRARMGTVRSVPFSARKAMKSRGSLNRWRAPFSPATL